MELRIDLELSESSIASAFKKCFQNQPHQRTQIDDQHFECVSCASAQIRYKFHDRYAEVVLRHVLFKLLCKQSIGHTKLLTRIQVPGKAPCRLDAHSWFRLLCPEP